MYQSFGDLVPSIAPPFPGTVLDAVNYLNDHIQTAYSTCVIPWMIEKNKGSTSVVDFPLDQWMLFYNRWNIFYFNELNSWFSRLSTSADEINSWNSEWENWIPILEKIGYKDYDKRVVPPSDTTTTIKFVAVAAVAVAGSYALYKIWPSKWSGGRSTP